ncbi:MAG: class I SAM-dependent methyltransferase [Actinobacteria bacterium]|nr:class I SAM-dependent methyltransferase [Actinomycetota bacterium]
MTPPPKRPDARALDVGGGMGEFAEVLRSKGYTTDLADLSASNVENARERGFGAMRVDLNEGLPGIEDATYDVVAMLEVIEHVVNSETLLREAARVVRPGGEIVLSTPNVAFLGDRLHVAAGRPPIAEGYHYRFFTIVTMRALFAAEGIRIREERFSSPAVGLNRLRRLTGGAARRRHVMIPPRLAPVFAQTMYFRGSPLRS